MKHIILPLLIFIAVFIWSCANQGNPTGGPKDTIPPVLIKSIPSHKQTNYNKQEFTLIFNEKINADRLKQHLIITPFIDNPYKFKVKRNIVTLRFEQPFDSATTYTFNFAEGIGDITENNSPDNLKLAFSTGSILDSLSISGHVHDIFTNKPIVKALVSLYSEHDSVNAFTGKPRYFTKTDKEGYFFIENIKNGKYKLYALEDKNNNMKIESSDELHGFKSGHIDLQSSITDISIPVQTIDSRKIALSRGKNTGVYYDVLYNKYIQQYSIDKLDNNKLPIPKSNLISDNQTIRFYRQQPYQYDRDSLGIIITATDSLKNSREDTLFVKFKSSKRKPSTMTYLLSPESSTRIKDTLNASIAFGKPIISQQLDSISINYDSIKINYLSDSNFTWNDNHSKLHIKVPLSAKEFPDYVRQLLIQYQDTTNADSMFYVQKQYLERLDTTKIKLTIPRAAFISVELDTSEVIARDYYFFSNNDTGTISGNIISDHKNIIVQIVTPNYNVVQQSRKNGSYIFNNLQAGKYTFRVLIDTNGDGKWSPGNILEDEEPEPIYFYPETFDIRANWIIENVDIQF